MILDERGFKGFVEWTERVKVLLRPYGNPPLVFEEDRWKEWGSSLGIMDGFPIYPSPYRYKDWRDWVRDLNRCVEPPAQVQFMWSTIPNFAKNGAFSVNILTTYAYPVVGTSLALVGALPTGWAFDGVAILSHSGAALSGPNSIHFNATYQNITYPSNTFTVQGI